MKTKFKKALFPFLLLSMILTLPASPFAEGMQVGEKKPSTPYLHKVWYVSGREHFSERHPLQHRLFNGEWINSGIFAHVQLSSSSKRKLIATIAFHKDIELSIPVGIKKVTVAIDEKPIFVKDFVKDEEIPREIFPGEAVHISTPLPYYRHQHKISLTIEGSLSVDFGPEVSDFDYELDPDLDPDQDPDLHPDLEIETEPDPFISN